jgi:hypothetical protein
MAFPPLEVINSQLGPLVTSEAARKKEGDAFVLHVVLL